MAPRFASYASRGLPSMQGYARLQGTQTRSSAVVYPAAQLIIFDVTVMVVFVGASFEQKTAEERRVMCAALQQTIDYSTPGTDAVVVWQDEAGRMKFISPPCQERFFGAMKYDQLYAQADRTVTLTQA